MNAPFEPLPRRAHFVREIEWAGVKWLVGVGLDHRGVAVEVFIDLCDPAASIDAEIIHFSHSAFITASHLLQHGVRAKAHADRLRAQSPDLLVLALDVAAEFEDSDGEVARWAYQLISAADHRRFVGAEA